MKRERNNSDEEDYDEEPIPKRPRKSQAMLKRDTPRKSEAFKAAILPDTPENTSDNTAGLSVLLADINKKGARVKILETSLRDLEEEKDTLQDEFNELYEKHEQLKRECTEVVKLQEALAKARGERELISVHYKSMEARLIECSRENDELKKNDNYKYRFICEDQKKSIDAMDAELQTARTRLRQDGVRLQQQVALYKRLFYAALVLIITLAASWSWTSLKVDNPVELSSGTELKYKKQLNNKHFTLVTRANTYTNITVLSNSNRMGLSVYNTRGWYASDNSAHGVLFDRYTVMDSLLVYTAAVEELSVCSISMFTKFRFLFTVAYLAVNLQSESCPKTYSACQARYKFMFPKDFPITPRLVQQAYSAFVPVVFLVQHFCMRAPWIFPQLAGMIDRILKLRGLAK